MRHISLIFLSILVFILVAATPVDGPLTAVVKLSGTNQPHDDPADRKAIEAIGISWQDAWNRHDMDALTALLAENVDFVTVLGPKGWIKGQKEFKEAHTFMHKNLFTESVWKTKETHVKFIRPDLAIARVLWETKGDKVRHVKHGEPREGIFTWVLEKQKGKWLIIASQNTESMPPLAGQ
ncbi:hypothetical protein BN8_02393 [Fibrisoma limi BUZ 3]|uniref:DUF4440 domain-containing protein n=1 Tax=Fibrisoma limi BUZ 3 TaxID=1185876 RepID=I2GHD1_9BACT|nr:SgcJ/EcaC family oxidoreductase [Fibrisoma limi]CCH53306.1 hypothetical protein BN8_02393 [Fibrisoma limi BUZ 3]